jgi:hypothetical protein
MVRHVELTRVRTPVEADGDGLASPNELTAALAEAPPASESVLAGASVRAAIGLIPRRLPISIPSKENPLPSGESGPLATMSSQGMSRPSVPRWLRKPVTVPSDGIFGYSPNFISTPGQPRSASRM